MKSFTPLVKVVTLFENIIVIYFPNYRTFPCEPLKCNGGRDWKKGNVSARKRRIFNAIRNPKLLWFALMFINVIPRIAISIMQYMQVRVHNRCIGEVGTDTNNTSRFIGISYRLNCFPFSKSSPNSHPEKRHRVPIVSTYVNSFPVSTGRRSLPTPGIFGRPRRCLS